ncbi:SigB/SigF/SigG family RNA polymerase sigma factor [Streptomyces sp. NPDC052040]|uniref:SigB/SigF/SigG family RNA polymerase sigma factor n=1 Tax=Streptomyces sp. NPDC052040 TaxID=3365682 RepID=UPI0037D1FEE9
MRDEERGTRDLSAGTTGGPNGSRRAAGSVDGIPEQARPHPEDGASAVAAPAQPGAPGAGEALSARDTGRGEPDGAPRSTPSEERGASPAHGGPPARARSKAGDEPRARGRVTGGTMSEHERNAEQSVPGGAQHEPQNRSGAQHEPQDRSGARSMFVELRALKDGSPEYAELRNRLVRMHLPLVEHLARRFRNRGEPLDDLTQVATIGLIKSVDRFDPDRGVEFSTYATPTVVGEIKRHFRDKGWAVRVPRRLQELRLALTTATAELSQLHGRSPTVHELAEKLAISEEEVLEGLESANAYSTLSLDVPDTDDESPAVADTLGAEDEALEGVEYRESLKPLLEDLPPREKRILLLRFFGNMTQSQIAQEVGISQMHVSRLLARTLAQLREKLLVEE